MTLATVRSFFARATSVTGAPCSDRRLSAHFPPKVTTLFRKNHKKFPVPAAESKKAKIER